MDKMKQAISAIFIVFCFLLASEAIANNNEGVHVVAQLYRDFAWEAVIEEPELEGHLLDQPRQVLCPAPHLPYQCKVREIRQFYGE